MNKNYKILGFDIGITSVGWAFVEDGELKDCGVRIFTEAENPKNGKSLALPRREARGSRRRLSRRKTRLNAIKRLLCKEFGLNLSDYVSSDGDLPKAYQTSKDTKSPYELRTLALEQKLESKDFARVILHIAKHRGYGNKHAKESSDDKDSKGKGEKEGIKAGIEKNKCYIDKYKTIGAYLYDNFYRKERTENKKHNNKEGDTQEFVNVRNRGQGYYERCLKQEWLKSELEIIFKAQRKFGFNFSDKTYEITDENGKSKELDFETAIMEVAFLQRPLKNFSDKVGKCTFYENEPRAPKDSLSAMEFIALGQIINTLRNLEKQMKKEYGEVYDKEKVQEILNTILSNGKITYKKMREILVLPENIYFPKGKNLDYTKGNISTQIKSLVYKISKGIKRKEKECIYTKEQEMQIYSIVRENGGISYVKLREILNLEASIKFDEDLLGKNKGLDYTKENIEAKIKEIKEKDPESSVFMNFENLVKFKAIFEPKESKKKSAKISESDDIEDFEESDEAESSGEVFANLAQNHRDELDCIAQDISNEKNKDKLRQRLESYEILNGKDEWLDKLSELSFSKHINLSFKALEQILPFMREGMLYDEALKEAGLKEHKKHKAKRDFLPPLEKYEPYLANPVVVRALSEYRKVCNALLKKIGRVHKIHIELAREIGKSHATRQAYEKIQKENLKKKNEAKELLNQYCLPQTDENILKARFFREQGEYCAYSAEKITVDHLKDPTMLQIDHIYPRSRSFDDSIMNKVLVFTKENQNKINKTPYEAFGKDKEKWETIKSFAKNFLPQQKYRRIINKHFADKQNEFKERNLNDTRYIAKLTLNYTKDNLSFEPLSENECMISGEKNSKVHCEAVSGTLTTNLRHIWGFDDKNRDNHLHHALDAIIIAHVNASMIQRFSEYYKQKNELKIAHYKKRDKLRWQLFNKEISQIEYGKQDEVDIKEYKSKKEVLKEQIKQKFCLPYADFHKIVQEKIDKIFVSKPPRKRARGALHEETFYSFDDKKLLKSYGGKEGVERALRLGKIRKIGTKIVNNDRMVRTDIFKHKQSGKFYGVPIYTMDFALGVLPNKAVVGGKDKDGVIKDWIEMDSNYEFCFSLFKDDLILVQKNEMQNPVLCYYIDFISSTAGINFEKHNNLYVNLSEDESKLFTSKKVIKGGKKKAWEGKTPEEIEQLEKNRNIIGGFVTINDLKVFEKWHVSPLGEVQKIEGTPQRESIALKSSPKKVK